MKEILPDLYLLEGLQGANVYLLLLSDGLTLIDTGMPGDFKRILAQLKENGFQLSSLERIILTHSHGDHVGGLAELTRLSGARVLAHEQEIPYLEQTQPLPASSGGQRLLFWIMNNLFFRLPPLTPDQSVSAGDVIGDIDGVRVLHTPGHTPGSMSLYDPERQVLFCGDALFNAHPLTGRPGLRFPIPVVTTDRDQARGSVASLADCPISVLCPGHGAPLLDDVNERIRTLLEKQAL